MIVQRHAESRYERIHTEGPLLEMILYENDSTGFEALAAR